MDRFASSDHTARFRHAIAVRREFEELQIPPAIGIGPLERLAERVRLLVHCFLSYLELFESSVKFHDSFQRWLTVDLAFQSIDEQAQFMRRNKFEA